MSLGWLIWTLLDVSVGMNFRNTLAPRFRTWKLHSCFCIGGTIANYLRKLVEDRSKETFDWNVTMWGRREMIIDTRWVNNRNGCVCLRAQLLALMFQIEIEMTSEVLTDFSLFIPLDVKAVNITCQADNLSTFWGLESLSFSLTCQNSTNILEPSE